MIYLIENSCTIVKAGVANAHKNLAFIGFNAK